MERIEGLEDFFRAGADEIVVGELHPADFSGGIEDEFGGAGDVCAAFAAVGVDKVPAADESVLVVAEEQEGISGVFPKALRFVRGVHADGRHANFSCVEFRKFFLKTPQLGVAGGSPIAAIKNQDKARCFVRGRGGRRGGCIDGPIVGAEWQPEQIRERDGMPERIRDGEIRGDGADLWGASRGRELACHEEDHVAEKGNYGEAEDRKNWPADFSAISVRLAEGAPETDDEQDDCCGKENQIGPREIARDRPADEKKRVA
jgi:hypothetical protein